MYNYMKYNKKVKFIGLTVMTLLIATGCQKLDVIGNGSVVAFNEVLNAIPEHISENDNAQLWRLEALDGSAVYSWSKDYSKTENDALLEIDLKPFVDAGLDTTKLPKEMIIGDNITVGINFGDEILSYEGEITPIASYKQIVKLNRQTIGHHAALDHFGIDLGGGNMFEWAKDMSTNDKDMVFVLNPEVFINAGVNVNEIEGWTYAKVETMDKNGKKIEVDKLLKPFDVK